jgi:hypothetical protein
VELDRVEDSCAAWCRSFPGFVQEATDGEVTIVATIATAHPDWVSEGQNEADPWLVAHAAVHDRVVVTEERRKGPDVADRNLKIPNVADEHGVRCIDFNNLARERSWVF